MKFGTKYIAGGVFVCFFIFNIFLIMFANKPILTGNEGAHYKVLKFIVKNKSFGMPEECGDDSYYKGKYYSNKPPGYVFLLAPVYFIYTELFNEPDHDPENQVFWFCKVANSLFSALAITCVFIFLATYRLSIFSRVFGMIAAALGTIFPAYSCLANSIPLSICLIILSILFFRMAQISKKRTLYLAGSLIASTYSVIVDYSNAFFLLPLFVAVFIELVRNRKLAIAFVIIAVQVFILFSYNYVVFGKVFVLSYSYYVSPEYVPWTGVANSMKLSNMPSGLYGLLVSPSRGLFLLSPVTILGMATFWLALKERNFNLLLIFGMVFSGILFISAYQLWHGGHCVGYRHILPSAILLGMLSAFLIEKSQRYLKILCTMVLIFSMFTGISSFFIQIDKTLLRLTWKSEPADIHSNFYSELLYPVLKTGFLDEKIVKEKH